MHQDLLRTFTTDGWKKRRINNITPLQVSKRTIATAGLVATEANISKQLEERRGSIIICLYNHRSIGCHNPPPLFIYIQAKD